MTHLTESYVAVNGTDVDIHIVWDSEVVASDYDVGDARIWSTTTEYTIQSAHMVLYPDVEYHFDDEPESEFDHAVVDAFFEGRFEP